MARRQERPVKVKPTRRRPFQTAVNDPVVHPIKLAALFHKPDHHFPGKAMVRMRIEGACDEYVIGALPVQHAL